MISKFRKLRNTAEKLKKTVDYAQEINFKGQQSIKKMIQSGLWKVGEKKLIGTYNNPFTLTSVDQNGAHFEGKVIEFDPHTHGEEIEICTVISGTMKDKLVPGTWLAGQICKYDAMEPHHPFNPDLSTPCIIKVQFIWDN